MYNRATADLAAMKKAFELRQRGRQLTRQEMLEKAARKSKPQLPTLGPPARARRALGDTIGAGCPARAGRGTSVFSKTMSPARE